MRWLNRLLGAFLGGDSALETNQAFGETVDRWQEQLNELKGARSALSTFRQHHDIAVDDHLSLKKDYDELFKQAGLLTEMLESVFDGSEIPTLENRVIYWRGEIKHKSQQHNYWKTRALNLSRGKAARKGLKAPKRAKKSPV